MQQLLQKTAKAAGGVVGAPEIEAAGTMKMMIIEDDIFVFWRNEFYIDKLMIPNGFLE